MTTEPRWLDDQQLDAWKRLVAVVELLPGVLDSQLRRDADLSHFEYYVLAMLSEAPRRTLRMTDLAGATNATLPRPTPAGARREPPGLAARVPGPEPRRATNAHLPDAGWEKGVATAPGHVATVRDHVIDALTDEQVEQLDAIAGAILERVDPDDRMGFLRR